MKKFKDYITEEPMFSSNPRDLFVVVTSNGNVQLRSPSSGGSFCQFGRGNAVAATIQGDTVVVTTKTGRTEIYKLNRVTCSVFGPQSVI